MGAIQSQIQAWFSDRLPKDWFEGGPEVDIDRAEILVVGTLSAPIEEGQDKGMAEASAIKHFREESREQRMEIAQEAQRLFNRAVSWGAHAGGTTKMFTGLGVPVMTRLRLRERAILDTLVGAGVARSRSEALAWCVSLVADKQKEWLEELRTAQEKIREVRRKGPDNVSLA